MPAYTKVLRISGHAMWASPPTRLAEAEQNTGAEYKNLDKKRTAQRALCGARGVLCRINP